MIFIDFILSCKITRSVLKEMSFFIKILLLIRLKKRRTFPCSETLAARFRRLSNVLQERKEQHPPEEPVLQIPDPNDDLFPNLGNPDPIPDVDDALIEAAYDNIHFAIEQIHLFHNSPRGMSSILWFHPGSVPYNSISMSQIALLKARRLRFS